MEEFEGNELLKMKYKQINILMKNKIKQDSEILKTFTSIFKQNLDALNHF